MSSQRNTAVTVCIWCNIKDCKTHPYFNLNLKSKHFMNIHHTSYMHSLETLLGLYYTRATILSKSCIGLYWKWWLGKSLKYTELIVKFMETV